MKKIMLSLKNKINVWENLKIQTNSLYPFINAFIVFIPLSSINQYIFVGFFRLTRQYYNTRVVF